MIKHQLTLEERISKLEKLIVEKTTGRNGEQSNAYKIWNFLMDNGPQNAEAIKSIFPPDKRPTIAANLAGFPKKGVIIKQGGMYAANPDYEWDDVGVITNRAAMKANIKSQLASGNIKPVEAQLITELSISEIIEMFTNEFENSTAGKVASLVLDDQDEDSFECTIEFDNYDYLLKLSGDLEDDVLRVTVPCTVYNDSNDEVGEVSWKGQPEFVASCNKVRALRMVVGLCSAAIISMMEQFDELD